MLDNRLKQIRQEHGLSQQSLAMRVEVSRQTIISIENKKYRPSIELAFKLARYFNCQIEDIFIWEDQ